MCFTADFVIVSLKTFHILVTWQSLSLNIFDKVCLMFCRSVFILCQLALLYKGMVLDLCCSLTGLRSNSVYTMSWSEMPGMVSVLITLPWWFVRIRSCVLLACWFFHKLS